MLTSLVTGPTETWIRIAGLTVYIATAAILACAVDAAAQSRPRALLDPHVVSAVDQLYPGFTEILESQDSTALATLAQKLTSAPSPESLSVLLWMLRYCPSWSTDAAPAVLQIERVVRSVRVLPVILIADALLHAADADQRITAAVVLGNGVNFVSAVDRDRLEQGLIAALSDPNIHVREFVAGPLRSLGTDEARRALARAIQDPNATDMLWWLATGTKRPVDTGTLTSDSFPAETVAALNSIAPDFLTTLRSMADGPVRQLIAAIDASHNPDTTPALVWLLAHGDMPSYGQLLVNHLLGTPLRSRIAMDELIRLLASANPDHRVLIVDAIGKLLQARELPIPSTARERAASALIERVNDVNIDVSTHAVQALQSIRTIDAVGALVVALNRRDATGFYLTTIVYALGSIGSREALPALERVARSADSAAVRETAARIFVTIERPSDPVTEQRRLLWEAADTALERQVLDQGKPALPQVWRALTSGTEGEQRAAAALLGWFPDVRSVRPILAALGRAPGALTRDQLLFDLNMIALTEGTPASDQQRDALAAVHVRWLYDQLATQPIDADIRTAVLQELTIATFPDRLAAPFEVAVSARSYAGGSVQPQEHSARVVLSESQDAFRRTVAQDGCGVAFHAISIADTVARVATTLYLPRGRIANQVWISLYRLSGGQWIPLEVPSHPVLHRLLTEPNLMPTINRNYGINDPLKVLTLDLTMERIRVDLKANHYLTEAFNRLDASYVPLLERYRSSDAPSVQYTAEFEIARLIDQPDLALWMRVLAERSGTPFQVMAEQTIGRFASRQLDSEGQDATGSERDDLIAAAVTPDPVDPRLVPRTPQPDNIRRVRISRQFAAIDVAFGSIDLGPSGYTMLLERRGTGWKFLFVSKSWIS